MYVLFVCVCLGGIMCVGWMCMNIGIIIYVCDIHMVHMCMETQS